jgi:hypothetical protein
MARFSLASKRASALLEGFGGLLGAAGERQDLSEVGAGLRLRAEVLRRLADLDGLPSEQLRLLVFAAPDEHPCPRLPPEHLRHRVVGSS